MEKLKTFFAKNGLGMLVCLGIAVPSWALGKAFPIIGGAVIAIIIGMIIATFWLDKGKATPGIGFTSKYVLQAAVVLLGFGINMGVILETGRLSLPIIVSTIAVSLLIAWVLRKVMTIPTKTATLVGVGSSICGGSAIAATAPVIDADSDEVAQAIAVIFFFNVLAAILFPLLGTALGFDTTSGVAFGVFAGTAINDTSSVTAAAATWDSMWGLGTQTLDVAVTVKLTRTLAIIPITLVLALYYANRARKEQMAALAAETASEVTAQAAIAGSGESTEGSSATTAQAVAPASKFSLKRAFPLFILLFICASIVTTLATAAGVSAEVFAPLKELSKFCIIMAMAAIGLSSNVVKLVKTGGKPLILGATCWVGITAVSLIMQRVMGIW